MKLALSQRVLAYRKARPDLFAKGDYLPLDVSGPKAAHVLAFARGNGNGACVVVVPRLATELGLSQGITEGIDVWKGTTITLPKDVAERALVNELDSSVQPAINQTGDSTTLDAASVLSRFPVAFLTTAE